jgi:hypothetical protein
MNDAKGRGRGSNLERRLKRTSSAFAVGGEQQKPAEVIPPRRRMEKNPEKQTEKGLKIQIYALCTLAPLFQLAN